MKKDDILKDLDTSLQTLGTDYVDVWLLHARDTPARVPDEAIEALEIGKKSGKARFIGFSCHDTNNMVDFALKAGKFDIIQTTYSFAIGSGPYREQAIARLHEAGIGVVAMKVVVALSGLHLQRGQKEEPHSSGKARWPASSGSLRIQPLEPLFPSCRRFPSSK